ncbi:hypothetical protein AVENLUH5627_03303 [Acinetobacter venetianus]|uniref:Uncharacterized protein n=1 Tax=Acinetobacter venetianus TaxID=52133 RepID=A0A150HJP0_9GAMM|nr:hypothetical protein [Acinetobacter venetianus]KXZ63232.1 hypothetical protein AVENLUH5627_03303 [Acinetobacter venetianus]
MIHYFYKQLIMIRILISSLLLISNYSFALTAEEFVMEMNIRTVGAMIVFDERDDPNNQLGRPNQYVEKTSWADTRIDPHDFSEDNADEINDLDPTQYKGGTIEKFKNTNDLNRRYNYIKNITLNMPTYNQYMYKKGLFLLRLDKDFTPTQAKEYEKELNRLVK